MADPSPASVPGLHAPEPSNSVGVHASGQFDELTFSVWGLRSAGYMTCGDCAPGPVDRTDPEECEACCEHALCSFHEGMEFGQGRAIRTAQRAWGIE